MTDASLYMIGLGAEFQCMIDWGTGPCYVILQEEGFLPMSELNKLLLLKFLMNTLAAEIRKGNLFMTTLIGLDGAQKVCPGHRRGEFRGCIRQRHWRKKEKEKLLEGESGLKFGVSSQRPMKVSNLGHQPRRLT